VDHGLSVSYTIICAFGALGCVVTQALSLRLQRILPAEVSDITRGSLRSFFMTNALVPSVATIISLILEPTVGNETGPLSMAPVEALSL
jgi:hypothetical protein